MFESLFFIESKCSTCFLPFLSSFCTRNPWDDAHDVHSGSVLHSQSSLKASPQIIPTKYRQGDLNFVRTDNNNNYSYLGHSNTKKTTMEKRLVLRDTHFHNMIICKHIFKMADKYYSLIWMRIARCSGRFNSSTNILGVTSSK